MTFCISIYLRDIFNLTDFSQIRDHNGMIELLSDGDVKETRKAFFLLKKISTAKIILTLRPSKLNGSFLGSEKQRYKRILLLLSLCSPDYLDLENFVSKSFIFLVKRLHSHIKIIISYHNFTKKFINLNKIFLSMKNKKADYYKIASVINNFESLSYFFNFLSKKENLIIVIIGEKWSWTRILMPFIGSCWSYCSLHGREQFGQISFDILQKEYKIKRFFCSKPYFYALLGEEKIIKKSPGHIFHNEYFANMRIESIYLKISVSEKELRSFINFAKLTNYFRGFSITSPLKKKCMAYLDSISEEALRIGSINTIKIFNQSMWIGYNTDAQGAFDYLEDIFGDISNKIIAILGSGGAALALLYEAMKRCSQVFLFARNKQERKKIEKKYFCLKTSDLNNLSAKNFDIIINTITPCSNMAFVKPTSSNIIFDISISSFNLTPLLQEALKKGARVAYGYGMFIYQAIYQQNLWNNSFQKRIKKNK